MSPAAPGIGTASPIATASPPPASTSPAAATSTVPAGAGLDGLAPLVEDLVARDKLSGVVLIARDEDVVWETAAGLANRE